MKVQKLEKLCRALQLERNELSKKVQDLSSAVDGRSAESPQQAAEESSADPETPPTTQTPACHCSEEPVVCSAQD